jgi:hypothetical protein
MIVGVCYTKNRDNIIEVLDGFCEGILNSADSYIKVKNEGEIDRLHKCDVIVQYGEFNGGNNLLRGLVNDYCLETKKPKLIMDIGFLKNDRWVKNSSKGYTSIGLNCTKGYGQYFNQKSPPDRWRLLGLDMKGWRIGNKILILGQMAGGVSTRHFNVVGWYAWAVQQLRKQTNCQILLRPHPNQKVLPDIPDKNFDILPANRPFSQDLEDVLCVITKTSNSALEPLIEGIPIITDDDLCIAYPLANHSYFLKDLIYPNREQFLYNLAYSQWNLKEIKQGLPWKHFRSHLQKLI